jgi:hypothetical protein
MTESITDGFYRTKEEDGDKVKKNLIKKISRDLKLKGKVIIDDNDDDGDRWYFSCDGIDYMVRLWVNTYHIITEKIVIQYSVFIEEELPQ